MKIFHSHHELSQHHRYQLEIIFLFASGFFLFFPYLLFLEEYHLDAQAWQWYFFWPWMLFYIAYTLAFRTRIPDKELQSPMKRPIIHWVLFGITTLAFNVHFGESMKGLPSLDISFIIFSIFLADSYWDFRNVRKQKSV